MPFYKAAAAALDQWKSPIPWPFASGPKEE